MESITFTTFGSNAMFGAFQPGDSMRVSAEMATHLVDELGCAVRGTGKPARSEGEPAGGIAASAQANAQAAGAAASAADDASKMTAAELRAALDAKGITYKANASKADLLALIPAA